MFKKLSLIALLELFLCPILFSQIPSNDNNNKEQNYAPEPRLREYLLKYYKQSDSFSFDFSTFKNGESLFLTGEIRDCGEFGGHHEHIIIRKNKSKFTAKLIVKKIVCPAWKIDIPRKVNYKKVINVDSLQRNQILNYVLKFNEFSPKFLSNAPTVFKIQFRNGKYEFEDPGGSWNGWILLRDSLFLIK
ncbi:MAG: hypothetical protein KA797_05250 [Chitinophagales bacterium]|nr:hypothetical protein [Chitinophagales bacterium]